MEFVVQSFYGTHVMNVASWKAAYCLFPRLTLEEDKMCLFSVRHRQELLAFDKYVGRGFSRLDVKQAAKRFEELSAVRRVGDTFSRKLGFSDVPLDGEELEDVKRRPLEEFEFKFNGWRLVKTGFAWTSIVGESDGDTTMSGEEEGDDN